MADLMNDRLALAGAAMFTMLDELLGAGFLPEDVEDDTRACLTEWTTAWKAAS